MTDLREQVQTGLADRYRLERELGRGGMATVYLAEDLRHHRLVALKVLRRELAASLGPDRFLREIETAARLQHPHILPLLDSGKAEGVLFYVMPFVEGESLRQRLEREGQLPLDEALGIARGVAAALEYAHQQGVIHRDIKPENILLYQGEPMVADFGIALAAAAAGGERLTETGLSLGTPAYMSPEQASAPGTLSGRSDQYSLACVVYEMLTGEPPYTGPTPQAVIAKRFHAPVPSVRHVRHEIPVSVDQALHRALATSPADRFATMKQMSEALAWTGTSRRIPAGIALLAIGLLLSAAFLAWPHARGSRHPASQTDPRLAVLPFRVLGDGVQVWREGMVDLLSINLDGAAGLSTVHPRTVLSRWHRDLGSSEATADQEATLEVARKVGARYSVSGTLLAAGARLTLTAEVQDALTGAIRGHVSVTGSSDSVPLMVDRLSLELLRAGLLGGSGADSVVPNAGRLMTTSVPALKAYLEGERAFRQSEPEKAEAAFRRAVDADSGFALAHYRLAAAKMWTGSPHQPQPSSEDSAALRLADRLPERDRRLFAAHVALTAENPASVDMLKELTTSHPDDAEAWYLLGEAYYHLGSFNLLPIELFRAAERQAITLDPGFTPAYLHLTEDAFFRLDSTAAGALVRQLEKIAPRSPKTTGLSLAYARSWGDSSAQRRARAAMDTASTLALLTAKHATNFSPDLWQQTAAAGLALAHQTRHPSDRRGNGYGGTAVAYALRGRIHESVALWDSAGLLMGKPHLAVAPVMYYAVLGLADSAITEPFASQAAQVPGSDSIVLYGMYLATRRRFDEVERAARALEQMGSDMVARGDTATAVCRRAHAKVLRAFAAGMREGVRAIPAVREAAMQPWVPDCEVYLEPQRLLLIRLLVEAGKAADAVPFFNGFDPLTDWDALAQREYYRGRTAEQLGEREEAIQYYSRFVSWWDKADAHLWPMREEARSALSRLTAEPRAGP